MPARNIQMCLKHRMGIWYEILSQHPPCLMLIQHNGKMPGRKMQLGDLMKRSRYQILLVLTHANFCLFCLWKFKPLDFLQNVHFESLSKHLAWLAEVFECRVLPGGHFESLNQHLAWLAGDQRPPFGLPTWNFDRISIRSIFCQHIFCRKASVKV